MASVEKTDERSPQPVIVHLDMPQEGANNDEIKEEAQITEADILSDCKPVSTPNVSQDSFQPETFPLKPESVYNIDEETRMGPDIESGNGGIVQSRTRERMCRESDVLAKPSTKIIPNNTQLDGMVRKEILKLDENCAGARISVPVTNADLQPDNLLVKHGLPVLPLNSSSILKSEADLSSDCVAKFAAISQEHDKYFADTEQSSGSFTLSKLSIPTTAASGTNISFSALSFIASEYAGSENSSSSPSETASVQEEGVLPENVLTSAFETVENPQPISGQEIPAAPMKILQDELGTGSMCLETSGENSGTGGINVTEIVACSKVSGEEAVGEQELSGFEKRVDLINTASSAPYKASEMDDKDSHPEQMDIEEGNLNLGSTGTAGEANLYQNFSSQKTPSDFSPDSRQVGVPEDSVLSFQGEFYDSASMSISMPRDQTENGQNTKVSGGLILGESASSSFLLPTDKSLLEGDDSLFSAVEESSLDGQPRSKRSRRSSLNSRTDLDSKLEDEEGVQGFPAEKVFEYQWPQDGGEWYLLQEQISEYLGVKSFKRKYPDLMRRTCDKLEKDFLREKGVVTETQSDLGLTALRSDEVYDLMMKDYPEKYHEYAAVLHEREKQTISDKHKEYEVSQPKLEKSKMADYMKKAAKSAAEYNIHFQRERREERKAYFDLQTFLVQYPEGRYKKLFPELTKPSSYPAALIPGQFQEYYCSYTGDELRYFPLNTALYDPPKKIKNTLAQPSTSESSSDDNSEDKSGSTSEDGSQDTGSCDSDGVTTSQHMSSAPATPAPLPSMQTPSKTPGKKTNKKVTKIRTKCKKSLESEAVEPSEASEATAVVTESTQVQTEDRDSCRICKNAVYQGRNKKVETKMIRCSECGKIAHPSCLDLTEKMVQVISTYPWQCMECKTCVECTDPYDEDKMMFCDRCDRGYHTFCVGLRCLPTGRWECRSCKGTPVTPKSRRGRAVQT